MFKRIFGSKITVLFLSMALIGFLIGYDYAMVTSKQDNAQTINGASNIEKMEPVPNMETAEENIDELEEFTTSEEETTVEEYSEVQEGLSEEELDQQEIYQEELNQGNE